MRTCLSLWIVLRFHYWRRSKTIACRIRHIQGFRHFQIVQTTHAISNQPIPLPNWRPAQKCIFHTLGDLHSKLYGVFASCQRICNISPLICMLMDLYRICGWPMDDSWRADVRWIREIVRWIDLFHVYDNDFNWVWYSKCFWQRWVVDGMCFICDVLRHTWLYDYKRASFQTLITIDSWRNSQVGWIGHWVTYFQDWLAERRRYTW